MITLHLGVIDIPYGNEKTTTGDVAEILEDNYKVMELFFDLNSRKIANLMAEDAAASLETMLASGVTPAELFSESMSQIHHLFSTFLDEKKLDGQVGGVPTLASIEGRSKRFKHGEREPFRPSFIDTGLYQNSMKAWVEKD